MTPTRSAARFAPLFALCVLALAASLAGVARAQQPVPPFTSHAIDLTGTLSADTLAALEARLAALEERTGAQLAVLIVPTTEPEAIEQYSLRVAETWELGRAGVDDGVLLLIAKDDRQLRIEVGYGLEGAIPDALANRIIDERIVPRFYREDYAGGIEAGIEALTALIEGEPLPPPAPRDRPDADGGDVWAALPFLAIAAAFFAPIFRRLFGVVLGPGLLAVGAGVLAWLVAGAVLVGVVVALIAFVFALGGGGPGRWSSGPRGRHGPFIGGYGGFGRGGGFGGGGFGGGGGGRFGGGGASGGW